MNVTAARGDSSEALQRTRVSWLLLSLCAKPEALLATAVLFTLER